MVELAEVWEVGRGRVGDTVTVGVEVGVSDGTAVGAGRVDVGVGVGKGLLQPPAENAKKRELAISRDLLYLIA
jgi:hypothetical protein